MSPRVMVLLICLPLVAADEPNVSRQSGLSQLSYGDHLFHATANAVHDLRRIAVNTNAEEQAFVWQEKSKDGDSTWFVVQREGKWSRAYRANYGINLVNDRFDPLIGIPTRSLPNADSGQLYLVQFHTAPLPSYREEITRLGGRVIHFLTNYTHLVQMNPSVADALSRRDFVRWLGPYRSLWRLEPFLQEQALAETPPLPQRYNLLLSDQRQKEAVLEQLHLLGAVNPAVSDRHTVAATLTADQLYQVVSWNEVLYADRWSPLETDIDKARDLHGADYLENQTGFTGQGVRGEVLDTGFRLDHVDFAGRPLIEHTGSNQTAHGAATSGILFGDGSGSVDARGMLPEGQGIVADTDFVDDGPSRYNHTAELIEDPYFAVFHSSSVGSSRTLLYSTISAEIDTMLFDLDLLHCQSQSNAKTRFSRPQAWAKNIVSGGGFRHMDTLDTADDCWGCNDTGASIGPAQDGRIKPDLSSFYDFIRTVGPDSTTDYTDTFGGTSGATPIICGTFGLFFEMWSEGIFGNPVDPEGSVFENRPHLSTAKAMMINTAVQYDFAGETHDFARVHQGWGRPDLSQLYDWRDNFFIIDESQLLSPFESKAYTLEVGKGETEFRATLVFVDPAGLPAAQEARINDLSLRVISPDGTVYWGNQGMLRQPFTQAGGRSNTVDTVENVWIGNPTQGLWTVEVIADEINQDGHVETPALDADFALVVSGIAASTPALTLTPAGSWPARIFRDTAQSISVSITDGTETLDPSSVTLHYRVQGAAFTELPMLDQGSGIFSGSLPGASCGLTIDYYISATTTDLSTVTLPDEAPTSLFSLSFHGETLILEDPLETIAGWSVGVQGDTATSGSWEHVVPLGRNYQPTLDHSSEGDMCFVTGQELNSNSTSSTVDLDVGTTTLISPAYELADVDAYFSFYLWFSTIGTGPQDDTFRVAVSDDDGANWEPVITVGPTGIETLGGWYRYEFRLADYVPASNAVRLKFIAEDSGTESLVEAALDDLSIFYLDCPPVLCQEFLDMLPSWPENNVLNLIPEFVCE